MRCYQAWTGRGPIHGPQLPKQPPAPAVIPERKCAECGGSYLSPLAKVTRCGSVDCERSARARRWRTYDTEAKRDIQRRYKRKKRAMLAGANREPYEPTEIAERDGWKCSLCGKPIPRDVLVPHPLALTMDHRLPLSCGGDDTPANVDAAHFRCNSMKGNRPRTGGEQLRLVG